MFAKYAVLICILVTAVACGQAPSGTDVYEKISDLWVKRDFQSLDEYVSALQKDYPGYCPAKAAKIVTEYLYGSCLYGSHCKSLVDELNQYEIDLRTAYPIVPPYYLHGIKDKKRVASRLLRRSEEKGITGDEPWQKYGSTHIGTAREDLYLYEFLLTKAPSLTIPMTREDVNRELLVQRTNQKLSPEAECEEAITILSQENSTDKEQHTAVLVLGKCKTDASSKALCGLLGSFYDPLLPTLAATTLVSHGKSAVPNLLKVLKNDSTGVGGDKDLAIWALVRSGERGTEIRNAIIDTAQKYKTLKDDCELALELLD